jgi:hypothetical protein
VASGPGATHPRPLHQYCPRDDKMICYLNFSNIALIYSKCSTLNRKIIFCKKQALLLYNTSTCGDVENSKSQSSLLKVKSLPKVPAGYTEKLKMRKACEHARQDCCRNSYFLLYLFCGV